MPKPDEFFKIILIYLSAFRRELQSIEAKLSCHNWEENVRL